MASRDKSFLELLPIIDPFSSGRADSLPVSAPDAKGTVSDAACNPAPELSELFVKKCTRSPWNYFRSGMSRPVAYGKHL